MQNSCVCRTLCFVWFHLPCIWYWCFREIVFINCCTVYNYCLQYIEIRDWVCWRPMMKFILTIKCVLLKFKKRKKTSFLTSALQKTPEMLWYNMTPFTPARCLECKQIDYRNVIRWEDVSVLFELAVLPPSDQRILHELFIMGFFFLEYHVFKPPLSLMTKPKGCFTAFLCSVNKTNICFPLFLFNELRIELELLN